MKTAALVLAILATVFGALGALLAFVFGSFAASIPAGLGGGTSISKNATWALVALVVGIVGTALVGRRPRVGAGMFVVAAVVGMIGTAAFALGALLYVIAAGLAFFVKPIVAAAESSTAAAPALATAGVEGRSSGRPRLGRRSTMIALGAVVLVIAIVATTAIIGQASEQRPATALFDAIQQGDDAALAALLPSASRSGNATVDAQTALRTALGNSSLAFLTQDWLRSLGPTTGTTMAFENLKTTTVSKTDDKGVVRMTGIFAPSNPNPLVNALLQAARVGFQADVPTARDGSSWYLDARRVSLPPPTPTAGGGSTPKPPDPPTPTPSPTRAQLPTTTLDGATFTADFNSAANLPTPGPVHFGTYTLAYQGGHALLNGCKKLFSPDERCFWGVNRPAGFLSVAATATSQAEWGIVLREVVDDWVDSQALNNAALGSINPQTGQYQVIIVAHAVGERFRDGGQTVATGSCDCINRNGPNTVEFDVRGAELVLLVNGVAATRVADTQVLRGTHYGVYWVGGYPDSLTSIDLTYFAGK